MSVPLAKENRRAEGGLLALYGVLSALRWPPLVLHGRIFAEEGSIYLRAAWTTPALQALVAPHLGYLALWPNLSGLLAAQLLPLPLAPCTLVWLAWLAQWIPGAILVRSRLFPTLRQKALALAVLLLGPNFEGWLNTINSQFFFVIAAVLLLLSPEVGRRPVRWALLLLAGLTGPATAALAPFFCWRAWLDRTRRRIVEAVLLSACAAVQCAVLLRGLAIGARQIALDPSVIAPVYFVRYLVRPFFSKLAETAAAGFVLGQATRTWGAPVARPLPLHGPVLLAWVLVDAAILSLFWWLTRDPVPAAARWLLAASLWLAVVSMAGAVGGTVHLSERYAFASSVLLGWSLLTATTTWHSAARRRRRLGTVLLGLLLLSGLGEYAVYGLWARALRPDAPEWPVQVEAWRRDPMRPLQVWPRSFAPFLLPPGPVR